MTTSSLNELKTIVKEPIFESQISSVVLKLLYILIITERAVSNTILLNEF